MQIAKTYLSGMQPSGSLQLGNYCGTLLQWLEIAKNSGPRDKMMYMIADLHSLTTVKNSDLLRANTFDLVASYIACGIDPNRDEKIILFKQSDISYHAEFAWIMSCCMPLGWLYRMTQFKDKSGTQEDATIELGLLSYPVLMACDILLYNTDVVPIGEDQVQHLEITSDIAKRFNSIYKSAILKEPAAQINNDAKRIMSLQSGIKKMSKSDSDQRSCISFKDSDDEIADKIKRAKTDSIKGIYYDKQKRPEISNLLTIFSTMSNQKIESVAESYQSSSSADFKKDLTDLIIEKIRPIRENILILLNDKDQLENILKAGAKKAYDVATPHFMAIKKLVGLL